MKTFSEFRGTLKEGKLGKLPDPPPMITLRRRGIRQFPTGETIVLYRNDKLNLDVSVPFSKNPTGRTYVSGVAEGTIVKSLERIVKTSTPGEINFDDGNKIEAEPAIAARILKLIKNPKLNWTNSHQKIPQKLRKSPKDFKQVADFTATTTE